MRVAAIIIFPVLKHVGFVVTTAFENDDNANIHEISDPVPIS